MILSEQFPDHAVGLLGIFQANEVAPLKETHEGLGRLSCVAGKQGDHNGTISGFLDRGHAQFDELSVDHVAFETYGRKLAQRDHTRCVIAACREGCAVDE